MHRLFRQDIDQFGHMFADRALSVFIKGRREANPGTIGQRTKAGIEMIEARINEFHRDHKTTEHVRNGRMRLNIGAQSVAATKCLAAEEALTRAFEVEIIGEPLALVDLL